MSSYLLNRKGSYHFRIRIPSDLANILPAAELVKSLKTKDKQSARTAALPYQQGIFKTFSLLRSGFISGEQAREYIDKVLNRKPQAVSPSSISLSAPCPPPPKRTDNKLPLSTVVKQFINDRRHGWGPKTKMENEGSYRLVVDILEDTDISSIDRPMVRNLRDKLMKLPGNVYKLFPRKTALQVLDMIVAHPVPWTQDKSYAAFL